MGIATEREKTDALDERVPKEADDRGSPRTGGSREAEVSDIAQLGAETSLSGHISWSASVDGGPPRGTRRHSSGLLTRCRFGKPFELCARFSLRFPLFTGSAVIILP